MPTKVAPNGEPQATATISGGQVTGVSITKTRQMPAQPIFLKVTTVSTGAKVGVDKENKVITGYVVAQEGPFKDKRGQFDQKSLRLIKKLMDAAPKGLKSRFSHPNESDDGLGKFLGRSKNPRYDTIDKKLDDGSMGQVKCLRADLHLDPTCFNTPHGDLGSYVMALAESDPDAFSSSLVLKTDREDQLDEEGRQLVDNSGEPLPTLWRPVALHASDVVDTGDAVDGFLSIDSLPDAIVRRGTELLDQQFEGQTREVVQARCLEYLNRYLDGRFGEETNHKGHKEQVVFCSKCNRSAATLVIVLPPADSRPKEEHHLCQSCYVAGGYDKDLDNGGVVKEWKPQKLAGYGGLTIGDMVEWWDEDDDCMCAERQRGIIKGISSDGPLEIPGTSLSLDGTVEDPAALIAAFDDDDDVTNPPDGDCMYLVAFSMLDKVVIPREEPTAGTTPIGYMSPEADTDDLLLEIEMRQRDL